MKDFVSKNKIKTRNTELNGSQIVLLITNQEERRYAKVSLGCPGVLQKSGFTAHEFLLLIASLCDKNLPDREC